MVPRPGCIWSLEPQLVCNIMHSVASSVITMPTSKAALQGPPPLSLPAVANADSGDLQEEDPSHALAPADSAKRRKRRSADRDGGGTITDEEDMSKTLYECRFCFMRFAKSQALGGHMNRHRQEREKEQYQHAQQLVSSMAQRQMPRTWNSIASSELSPSGAEATLARLINQLTRAPPREVHARPQFPPQISFNTSRPPPTSFTASIPSSSSSNYYLPSNSSSNNLHKLQWSVDGFSNTNSRISESQQQGAFDAVDTTLQGSTGAHMRDEFLASVLHSRQDGAFAGPQFGNMTPLFSRGLDSGGSFHSGSQDVQGGSGTADGLQFGHDQVKSSLDTHGYIQQPHRMTSEVLGHLASSGTPLLSLMPNSMPGLDTSKRATSFAGLQNQLHLNDNCKRPSFMMQTPGASTQVQQFNSLPLRQIANGSTQFHMTSSSSMYVGQSTFNPPSANFVALQSSHKFSNNLHDFENLPSMPYLNQGLMQRSSSLASSGASFIVPSSEHDQGNNMYHNMKMAHLPCNEGNFGGLQDQNDLSSMDVNTRSGSQGSRGGQQNGSVVEVVDGNHYESMNITTVESGDVSGLSMPPRYQSTDFSSGSPEWRPQMQNSPSAQVHQARPPSSNETSNILQ